MPDDRTDELVTRLQQDMKAAMKAGDKTRLGVVRMLLSDARAADLQKPPITPQQAVEQYHKRLVKSREEYEKLGDAAQVGALDSEIKIVEDYVPKKASAEETNVLVDDFLANHPEFGPGDVGKATGLFMKQTAGTADARAANARIKDVLTQRGG